MLKKYKKCLITGGCGFIGSHFIHFLLRKYKKIKIANVDSLAYAGDKRSLKDIRENRNYKFYKIDITDRDGIYFVMKKESPDVIVNFAAESDNNKAISSPIDFTKTNALGSATLIEAARKNKVKRFHQISTCEVFGEMPLSSRKSFKESSPFMPRTPYNASKAAADMIVRSYYSTFGFPVTISHCCNNYGSYQFPEKVIPIFVIKAVKNQFLPVFKSADNRREWINVLDHCRAIDLILRDGKAGESYNVGTGLEKSVMQIAKSILSRMNKPMRLIKIVPDRLGHDKRYLLDSSKIKKLGWKPKVGWAAGLEETIQWYVNNKWWWQPLLKKSHSWQKI